MKTRDGRTIGHSVEFLETERREKGAEFFANQYENCPIASGTETFTPELIEQQTLYRLAGNSLMVDGKEVKRPDIPQRGPVAFCVDMAFTIGERTDLTVIWVSRIRDGQHFIVDCIAGQFTPQQLIEQLFLLARKWAPLKVYIEKTTGIEGYQALFDMYSVQHGIRRLPVEFLKNDRKAKTLRIGSIHSVMSQKRVWLYAGMPHYDELKEQLLRYPKLGKHDDFADCLGLLLSAPTGYENTPIPSDEGPMPAFIMQGFKEKEPALNLGGGNGLPAGIIG